MSEAPTTAQLRAMRIQRGLLDSIGPGLNKLRLRGAPVPGCRPIPFLYWPIALGTGLEMARRARRAGLVTW